MKEPNLNRKLELEAQQQVEDGAGGYDVTWVALGGVWADVKSGTSRERGVEAITVSRMTKRITVRAAPVGALSRPQPDQRFREGTRVYRILAVSEVGAQVRYLMCLTEEEVLT
ncbi:MAG: head-tail adaptor [Paracoccaceae bacterium]|jgi:head-tail adaptor